MARMWRFKIRHLPCHSISHRVPEIVLFKLTVHELDPLTGGDDDSNGSSNGIKDESFLRGHKEDDHLDQLVRHYEYRIGSAASALPKYDSAMCGQPTLSA